jgi:FMN phosphatase YigB (HAD superfamily)
MSRYDLISFDMFQTLVDIDTRKEATLRAIFGSRYEQALCDEFWEAADRVVFERFHGLSSGEVPFVTVRAVFEECYGRLFGDFAIDMDPRKGAQLLIDAHRYAQSYDDAAQAVELAGRLAKTCLISDADADMVEPLLGRFRFDAIYLSERFGAYKSNPDGALFRRALADFDVEPGRLLHIGDGRSDVVGAQGVGADAAWLNRGGRAWKGETRPTYELLSLSELATLLGAA